MASLHSSSSGGGGDSHLVRRSSMFNLLKVNFIFATRPSLPLSLPLPSGQGGGHRRFITYSTAQCRDG
jgi:hypothetical protein